MTEEQNTEKTPVVSERIKEGEQTITLPVSKATVKLRDYKTLRYKDRRKVWASMGKDREIKPANGIVTIEAVLALIILEWTVEVDGKPLPIPSEAEFPEDSLGELENEDIEFLLGYGHDANDVLFNTGLVKNMENIKNPDSPLDKLNDSKDSSKE